MAKVIIREVIISLLVCLALLLILSVLFYNYIPSNKVIPETVQYAPSKEIQAEINSEIEHDSSEILMTYEITAQDLDNFERTNEYKPGKVNPFAVVTDVPEGGEGGDGNSSTDNGSTTIPSTNVGGSSSSNSGSLFENGSSK